MDDGATYLGDLTWRDIDQHGASLTLLVPVGSLEQHGPHLPLDTDTRIAKALCIAASSRVEYAVVAPELTYGASGEHQDFPGTISIGTEVLTQVLIELTRSALGPFARMVLVNGHGGNTNAVSEAVALARGEGRDVHAFWPKFSADTTDTHAGFTETSLMLALAPYAVAVDDVEAGNVEPLEDLLGRLQDDGVREHAPNGVLGDPEGANAGAGWKMVSAAVDDLVALVGTLTSTASEPIEA